MSATTSSGSSSRKPSGVRIDEGGDRLQRVRAAIANLKRGFGHAKRQVDEAETRARSAWCGAARRQRDRRGRDRHRPRRRATLEAPREAKPTKGMQVKPDPIVNTDDHAGSSGTTARTFDRPRDRDGARLEDIVPGGTDHGGILHTCPSDGAPPRSRASKRSGRTGTHDLPMALAGQPICAGLDGSPRGLDRTPRRGRSCAARRRPRKSRPRPERLRDHDLTQDPLTGVIGITSFRAGRLSRESSACEDRHGLMGLVSDISTTRDSKRADRADSGRVPDPAVRRRRHGFDHELARRKRSLVIGCVIDPDVPAQVVADCDRVRQVLLNSSRTR